MKMGPVVVMLANMVHMIMMMTKMIAVLLLLLMMMMMMTRMISMTTMPVFPASISFSMLFLFDSPLLGEYPWGNIPKPYENQIKSRYKASKGLASLLQVLHPLGEAEEAPTDGLPPLPCLEEA